jgi:hypothetical protein
VRGFTRLTVKPELHPNSSIGGLFCVPVTDHRLRCGIERELRALALKSGRKGVFLAGFLGENIVGGSVVRLRWPQSD